MKILNIIPNLSSGGAEKLLSESLPLMKRKGHEITVLLFNSINVYSDLLKDSDVEIISLNSKNVYNPSIIRDIKSVIESDDFDIVHSHLTSAQYFTSIAKNISSTQASFVTTEHNTFNRRRNYSAFKILDKKMYDRYDKVISISEATQLYLLKWLGIENKNTEKYTVIHNGIDLKRYQHAKSYKSKIRNPYTYIIMVARFSEQKDQLTLIKAMKKTSSDTRLLLVGEGHLIDFHKEYVQENDLDEKIEFLGFRSDVPELLKTSDIVVLSSNYEGFGLAAVEGMAAGKPVIISNVEGLNKVMDDRDLQFNVGDSSELANIINKLINDKSFYNSKVEYSLEKSQNFSLERYVDELNDCYLTIKT